MKAKKMLGANNRNQNKCRIIGSKFCGRYVDGKFKKNRQRNLNITFG